MQRARRPPSRRFLTATRRGIPSPRRPPRFDPAVGEVGSVARLWLSRTLPEVFRAHLPLARLRLIDVGCGSGAVADQLVRAGASGTYFGLDVVARPEWRGRQDRDLSIAFLELDACRLDELPGSFDAATAIMSFEHLEDDDAVLRGLARKLVGGGIVVLAVPAPASRWYLGGRHCFRWYRASDLGRLAEASGLELESLLTRHSSAGLVADAARYALFTGIARALRYAVYLRHRGDRARARTRSPWIRDVNTSLSNAWVSLAGGRVARSLAGLLLSVDDRLPGVYVAHIAVLRKPADA